MAGGANTGGEAVRLWTTKAEREAYDNYADLFALVKAAEKLEKAYVRDAVSAADYEGAMAGLIAKFRTLRATLANSGVPDVAHFMRTYRMDCPAAAHRLLVAGVPATVEHGGGLPAAGASGSGAASSSVSVAQAVQHFITAMDSLKLGMAAVDQVHPCLQDLLGSLHKVPALSPDFTGIAKIREWLARLNRMAASDELDEEQQRQLMFDLESSYGAFMSALEPANRPANG